MLGTIALRAAMPSDEPAVSRLIAKSYSVLLLSHYGSKIAHEASEYSASDLGHLMCSARYHVAEHGGQIIGAGGWAVDTSGTHVPRGTALLRRFAVDPDWTSRGIGRAIALKCLNDARLEVRRIRVRSSLNAVPFYASLGFAPEEPISLCLPSGNQLAAMLMSLDLCDHPNSN